MNARQAKQIPLQSILAKLGFAAHHEKNGEMWYSSPFRDEAQPSFKINLQENIWYDFGEGKGGNVLDFVLRYYRLDSIKEALRKLEDLAPAGSLEFAAATEVAPPRKVPAKQKEPAINLKKVGPLENRALTAYLKKRGVSIETARLYVQEMYYRYGDKDYFALAFPNQSGGYELRNPYFKGTFGAKDISVLGWEPTVQAESVTLFEGFIDYLSALTYYQKTEADTPVIVLNSVAMRERAVETCRTMKASKLHLYFDRDASGQQLAGFFREQLPHLEIVDHSGLYARHKDVNEWLVAQSQRSQNR